MKARALHPSSQTPNRGYSSFGADVTSVHGNLGKVDGKISVPLIDMKVGNPLAAIDFVL